MKFRPAVFAVACAAFPLAASAFAINKLPDGMCPLNASVAEHATIITYLTTSATGSELVTAFADCDELEDLAKKKITAVSHYGAVLKQPPIADLTMDRATYLATVSASMQKAAALTQAAVAATPAAIAQGASASGVAAPGVAANFKGVLYSDPRMVIIGVEQTNTVGGTATKVASTAAMTLIGTTPVSVNLYAPAADKDAFEESAEALKPTINRMIRDNK